MKQLRHEFHCGDAADVLRTLPKASVDCVVTSPPYWQLRDYHVDGQLGLEAIPEEFIEKLASVFDAVRRVLKPTGSVWVNLGDTYRDKQLLLIPARFALAMQQRGWILRNDIVWHKANAMPSSCVDRLSNRYEHLFHFVQRKQYFYDLDAIRVPWSGTDLRRRKGGIGRYSDIASGRIPEFGTEEYRRWYREQREKGSWVDHSNDRTMGFGHQKREGGNAYTYLPHPDGKNPGDVWEIATEPFAGAHFATFPTKLVEPCILATASPMVCPVCGAPWERVREKTGHVNKREHAHVPRTNTTKTDSSGWAPAWRGTDEFRPTCRCPGNDGSQAGVVLDPFGGSGTTSLVAAKLGRNSIYIDLNPEYMRMAVERLRAETSQMDLFVEHRIEAPGERGNAGLAVAN